MKKVIIFDYDGVIIDSYKIFVKYFIKACKKEGFSQISTEEDFLRLYEKNMYESMYNIGMNKDQILKIVYYMKEKLLENQDKIKLFPEIFDTCKNLAENNFLYIVTSNDTKVVLNFLRSKNMDFFKDIIGSDKEPSKIKKIQYIKNMHKSLDTYFIGDTKGDILEGKQAEVITIAALWGWHSKDILAQANPDFIVKKPEDLISLIYK